MTLAEQAEAKADEMPLMICDDLYAWGMETQDMLRQLAAALREREGAQQAGQVPQDKDVYAMLRASAALLDHLIPNHRWEQCGHLPQQLRSLAAKLQAALREREGAQQAGQVPQEAKSLTAAYAEGRGDQYEDDCRVVRLLFENLDDVDELGDGHINTTRVRELLSHFAAAPEAPAQPEQAKPDRTGMTYYKNNDCKAASADAADCICWTPAQPEQGEREALTAIFLSAMEWGRDHWARFSMSGHDQREIAEQFADKARAASAQAKKPMPVPCKCFDDASRRLCMTKDRCARTEAYGVTGEGA